MGDMKMQKMSSRVGQLNLAIRREIKRESTQVRKRNSRLTSGEFNLAELSSSSDDDDDDILHQITKSNLSDELSKLVTKPRFRRRINKLDEKGFSPLHYAARYNRVRCAKLLVEKGLANVGVRSKDGITPLHCCARKKQATASRETIELIKYLAFRGKINAKDNYGSTALHFAAMRGNVSATAALVTVRGIDVNAKDISLSTPLHEAATYNELSVAKLLIEHGAMVDIRDKEGGTPLHNACMRADNTDMIKLLIECTPEPKRSEYVNILDADKESPLHLAIDARNPAGVECLIDEGADLNVQCRMTSTGSYPVHLAAVAGEPEVMSMLLKAGAKLTQKDIEKSTALHKAIEYQHENIVKVILEHSKDPSVLEARDFEQFTPLLIAACYSNTNVLRMLLKSRADISAVEYRDKNVFHLASEFDRTDALRLLIKYASKKNKLMLTDEPDNEGETPLHDAARNGNLQNMKLLLKHKCDLSVKNEDEESPFLLAVKHGHKPIVDEILQITMKVLNEQDEISNTALHLAAAAGHVDIVQDLVIIGANKESRNNRYETPLDLAAKHGHENVVGFLLDEDISPNPIDTDKMAPLLLAAKNGRDGVVKLLIERGANVLVTDNDGKNCLDLAIDRGQRDVCLAIVQSDNWKLAMLNGSESNDMRTSPMRKLVRKMPDIAMQVLNRCVTHSPPNVKRHDPNYWYKFDYTFLDDTYFDYKLDKFIKMNESEDETDYDEENLYGSGPAYTKDLRKLKHNHHLMIMINEKRDKLLGHPVVLALTRHKWNVIRPIYFVFLVFYSLFVTLLTTYMLSAEPEHKVNRTACDLPDAVQIQTDTEYATKYLIMILAGVGIIQEIGQISSGRLLYLQFLNLLDWFTYISSFFVLIDLTNCGARTNWQWQLGAMSLFSCWINIILFMRRIPGLGLYIVMMTEILTTFFKFFVAFFLFIVAFAMAFYVLLQDQTPFSTPFYSIMKTWVMMLGEFDYNDLFHSFEYGSMNYEEMSYFFFVIFLIVMSIVLMNLLTALAVDDVGALQSHAKLQKIACQIELSMDIELAMPQKARKRMEFSVASEVVYPNRLRSYKLGYWMNRLMDGPILSMQKIIDSAAEIEGERATEIEELEETVKRKFKQTRDEVKSIEKRMENIEKLLQTLVGNTLTPRIEQAPDEDADDEDFSDDDENASRV